MSTAEVNQGMIGDANTRLGELGTIEGDITTRLQDPLESQYYGTALNEQLGNVKEAQGVLNHEVELRQNLDEAYKNAVGKDPDQDPGVKAAQKELNEFRKKNSKYYGRNRVASPCFTCIKGKLQFRTPASIIKAAQDTQRATGVPASITLAQWAQESGWGKSMPPGSNNPFGIKAASGQAGVPAATREDDGHGHLTTITATFRTFASLSDAFTAHANLIATGSAYKKAMAQTADPDLMADELQGTYATDSSYAESLKTLMRQNNFKQYDTLPPP
jgi:flagellum-specific peptidoglycan hydrolase FlgJ